MKTLTRSTQVRIHARKYAFTHASTHARTHAHTHTQTHTHTQCIKRTANLIEFNLFLNEIQEAK